MSMEDKGLKVNLCKTMVMKCEARFGPTENSGKDHVEFAGKASVQIVLSAINGYLIFCLLLNDTSAHVGY